MQTPRSAGRVSISSALFHGGGSLPFPTSPTLTAHNECPREVHSRTRIFGRDCRNDEGSRGFGMNLDRHDRYYNRSREPRQIAREMIAIGATFVLGRHEASSSCSRRTLRYRGIPGVDPLVPMQTSQILQHLYSLDNSSPDLSRYLYHLIQSDGEDPYLLGLQGPELTRLVDFLDTVRALPSAPSNLRNRLHRPSPSSRPPTMSPDCVYTSFRPFAVTTASYHLHTLFLAASPSLAITQLPLEASPMCGKGHTTTKKCV